MNKGLFEQPLSSTANLFDYHHTGLTPYLDQFNLKLEGNSSDEEEKLNQDPMNLHSVSRRLKFNFDNVAE